MNSALAGLVILVLGDSHMVQRDHLMIPLHDQLQNEGAIVHAYAMCGAQAADWVTRSTVSCGIAEYHEKNPPIFVGSASENKARPTWNVNELIDKHRPNLVLIEMGDTMAGYGSPDLPKPWVYNQVRLLTGAIRGKNLPCVWVGPMWGHGGTSWHKDESRTREMSQLLSQSVAPCTYIDSTAMSKPGEWPTTDGYHLTSAAYGTWARSITGAVVRWRTQTAQR